MRLIWFLFLYQAGPKGTCNDYNFSNLKPCHNKSDKDIDYEVGVIISRGPPPPEMLDIRLLDIRLEPKVLFKILLFVFCKSGVLIEEN